MLDFGLMEASGLIGGEILGARDAYHLELI